MRSLAISLVSVGIAWAASACGGGPPTGQVSGKVDTVVARSQPPQQRGPDPNRVYTINTVGSPIKGLVGAPVTIAEFSDFQ